MAATGDGTGGLSITSTSSYQTLFNATSNGGDDLNPVRAYSVQSKGEDAVVKVTFENGVVRIYNAPNGELLAIGTAQNSGRILKVEAKGETGIGIAIYGNVLVG